MVDRLSSLQIFQTGISDILSRQAEVNRTQQELATGRKVLTPADDPAAAVQILDLEEDVRLVDQYDRNASLAQGQLALGESTLGEVVGVLQRVRELTVQGNNATQSPETRAGIAAEVRARLDELLALANTRDANDEYIFAGFRSLEQPFSRSGGAVSYAGDDGQRFIDIAAGTQIAVRDPGSRVFLGARAGNGNFDFSASAGNSGSAVVQDSSAGSAFVRDDYTLTFTQALPEDPVTYSVTDSSAAVVASGSYVASEEISFNGARLVIEGRPADGDSILIDGSPRQSLFETVSEIAEVLADSAGDPASVAKLNNALASGLNNLDQAIGNVLNVQADVGVRLNRIESQRSINEDFSLQLQETLSSVRDLDYAEAISRLNLQLATLQAAQQTYVRTQSLSLFNFL